MITKKHFSGVAQAVTGSRQGYFILSWPVHETYRLFDNLIYPDSENVRLVRPLEVDDLFTSFARLAAKGVPSEVRIRSWVSRYGLLTREKAMSLEFFRAEAKGAHDLIVLLGAIRAQDTAAIERGLGVSFTGESITDAERNEMVIWAGTTDFERRVSEKLEGVRLSFGRYVPETNWTGRLSDVPELAEELRLDQTANLPEVRVGYAERHPALDKPYLPSPSWRCDDLLAGLYLQLYLMATGHKPMSECANPACGQPFFLTRKDRRFCNNSCRSNARNYR